MKKRSLFAAVAMLIVSAVVLTSATYAWFAGNSNVYVSSISATVDASTGSIQISPDNTDWSKLTIGQSDLDSTQNANANGVFPSALSPIDMSFSGGSFYKKIATFGTGDAGNQMTLSDGTSTTDTYIHYSFYVKASQANTTAYLVPTSFSDGTQFCYMAVKIGTGNWFVYTADGYSYKPLTSDSGTVTDDNTNYIVDSTDTGATGKVASNDQTVGTRNDVTPTNYKYHTLTLGTTATEIQVMVWAEGQDAQCIAAAGTESIAHSFNITLTQPS